MENLRGKSAYVSDCLFPTDNQKEIPTLETGCAAAEERGTEPYFIRDNKEYIQGILEPRDGESEGNNNNVPQDIGSPKYGYGASMKLGRNATKEAMKIVENIGAPELSKFPIWKL